MASRLSSGAWSLSNQICLELNVLLSTSSVKCLVFFVENENILLLTAFNCF